ncbi:translocation/assembly module TamB domain-containing protein [Flavobacterium cyanobacteriorum]|uniref:translocation/assembly module TamB domain-containing protein n=1 Tax=Flavobacterium cyanobacteriorum TaxID=2022802 RepID=UPI001FB018D2|nr:translocation/assembly module TamB domain-containing protein [Flavobacterium cyanobacteriorum]
MQTKIARYATETLNKDFGTNISIEKVAFSIFGGVKLKGVLVLDHHKDTLISATRIHTNVYNVLQIADSKLKFGTLRAEKLYLHMKTYKGENTSNLDLFIKAFDNGKPGSGKFRMRVKDLRVASGRFRLTNQNAATPRVLDFKKLNGRLKDFFIKGSDISAGIQQLSLLDHRGLFVENLKAAFTYTKKNIILDALELKTKESALEGAITLSYTKKDFKDFTNKVKFDFRVDRASISSNELNYFFNEFGSNQKFYLSTHLKGPLNNFTLHNLKLLDDEQSEIIGSVNFRRLFDKKGPGFYMNGNFDRVTSHYNDLRGIMPRILGKSLPPVLEKFGRIDLVGDVVLTKRDLHADVYLMSELGEAETNISIKDYNKPSDAAYTGAVNLANFNLGGLLDNKSLRTVSLNLEVEGQGFNRQSVNTSLKGEISELYFNRYNYTGITVDGRLKWPYFKGRVNSNDPNLLMSFDGLVDMGNNNNNYDFHAQIDYADLKALHIVTKDTIAVFKGDFVLDASGNNLNNLAGRLAVTHLSYQKNHRNYYFDDFEVNSVFNAEKVRAITINSKDIVEGHVRGIFDINELPKLVENALGSLYTNYSAHKVKKGQFLDFGFAINNKIVEVLMPEIKISDSTSLKGRINADKGEFQLAFGSPHVEAFKNYFDNIRIDVNNRNPLYNAYVQMDSARVKDYSISGFSLINVTQNDTLYLRSEFKGGKQAKDFFNLNLYHTIDKDNKSIVGFKKSEVNFKNYLWYLNEGDAHDNKIIFNKKLTDFTIDGISLSHNGQEVELSGILKGKDYKDLKLTFDDVDLYKVTPTLDSLNFGGRVNGVVSLRQNKSVFQPTASISVDSLSLNQYDIGNLDVQIAGDESLRRFNVYSTIFRNNNETFFTYGNIDIINKQTVLNLDAGFTNFDISPLTIFLKTIFPDMRGLASGRATVAGNARDPEVNGRLYLKNAGLKIGYLNTDYNFEQDAVVDFNKEEFFFRRIHLTDTKLGTTGVLDGSVKHRFFKDWVLGLNLKSDKLLVFDKEDSDDAQFYGTAIIKGEANIYGPTTALTINASAKSVKGTDIKIPMNNAASGGDTPYIYFPSPQEIANKKNGIVSEGRTYKGLEMNFDLDITPDANIEIIIDKNTGHGFKARGDGTLLLDINTLGKFNMTGDFSVREGIYNFKYGGIFDKELVVRSGGYISWEGDPKRARLNLEAVYKTQANPGVLLESSSFNRNIPVEVVIALSGNLTTPEHEFQINFPGASSVLKSDLEYRLNDFDTRQTQALSLLYSRTFLSPTNASNAVYAPIFERASSLVGDIFSDEESKVKVNLNYVQADRNPFAETASQIGVTLSSQINDRITVNGQLGVPVGGVGVNESAIVGNVEAQLRLNKDNTLKARVFNRENDINFLGEGIGYTQGVGLTYEVDFDIFSELVAKIFRKIQIQNQDGTPTDEIPDSEPAPNYIEFDNNNRRKKNNTEDKQPQRIPEVD